MTELRNGLDPIVDSQTKILILGSFPSEISLRKSEYYANPRNQFWQIIGDLFNSDIRNLTYKSKMQFLKSKGIGLWDVVKSCKREGSSDAKISNETVNDIKGLIQLLPNIKMAFLNGRKAEQIYRKNGLDSFKVEYLPSSSPALAMAYLKKKEMWKRILSFI